jgi:hypothetical protein
VAQWEASRGTVQGHRVILALDADRLAKVRGAPAVEDAVRAALAAAIATQEGESLFHLTLEEASSEGEGGAPYRTRPRE